LGLKTEIFLLYFCAIIDPSSKKGEEMSQQSEKIAHYVAANEKLGLGLSEALIEKVTKGLGPSIYKQDAETVSCSDSSELERVRENFLKKKLGLSQSDEALNAAIEKVCAKMGTSNPKKYRALFYALLAEAFDKTSVYA
jgi:hypothetical protein